MAEMETVVEVEAPLELTTNASPDLMALVKSAAQITDLMKRDAALLEALRICRKELEDAEAESEATQLRLSEAKDTFDCAAGILAGVTPSSLLLPASSHDSTSGGGGTKNGKRGALSTDNFIQYVSRYEKRSKSSSGSQEDDNHIESAESASIPTNPIHVPSTQTSVDAGDEQMYATHRENFYQKLLSISASEVENYTPNLSQANIRNKSQLADGIYIARHWDTGADGLDAPTFQLKHKTWTTKMKPVTHNSGRGTGIHLRMIEPHEGQEEGATVLCRYNKDATKSTIYLDVSQLYDALFEIHCLEHTHYGGNWLVKSRVDELYANVSDGQVKAFIDTCPICIERQGGHEETVKVQGVCDV